MARTPAMLLLTTFALTAPAAAQELYQPKAIRTVVIDPGHGGANLGALGITGAYEKDVNLAIARMLRQALETRTGIRVLLTRDDDRDVPFDERIGLANRENADLFISLHCNASFNQRASGIETFVLSEVALQEESEKLATRRVSRQGRLAAAETDSAAAVVKDLFQSTAPSRAKAFAEHLITRMVKRTGSKSRGVKDMPAMVLRGAEMPAVVVELGFLSHVSEGRRLASEEFQKVYASSLYYSILDEDERLAKLQGPDRVATD
ncbi:MAG: N-acetylmuramoyl-L-alanine amidase [Deltaproteobacteria bacterium]|nr:N-acetylmuramoyl-L-alanine amidase [Deltaproteobacteria bacterium]